MQTPAKEARAFIAELVDLDRSKSASESFRDFCEMAYCALAKRANPDPIRQDELERQYGLIEKRYSPAAAKGMGRLLGRATMVLGQGGCDFLGMVAGEIGMLDARMGQFFTPYDVSWLMAEITFGDADRIISEKGYITVHEPAAGAGCMLIAMADMVEARGHDVMQTVWVEAVELSRSTFHMAYVQLSLRGIPGRVHHGNSLSLEMWQSDLTPAAHVFLRKHGRRACEDASAEPITVAKMAAGS